MNVDNDAVLVSFVADYVTYSDLVLVDSVTTNKPQSWHSYYYGTNSINDPGSATNAITDNRLDSGIANVYTNAVFKFASAPTSLSDVFFLFDWKYAAADTDDSIQLVDSATNDIGTAEQMVNLAQLGSAEVALIDEEVAGIIQEELSGVAIPLSDFGIARVELSNVAGFKISGPGGTANVDPLIAGIASPPGPDLEITTTNGTAGVSGTLKFDNNSTFGDDQFFLKNIGTTSNTRKGYVRFDTSAIDGTVTNASLNLTISQTAVGSQHTRIYVYAITNQTLDSVELVDGLAWAAGPANDASSAYEADLDEAVGLGNFQVRRASENPAGTVKSFSNSDLTEFLNADTNNVVTFLLGREPGNDPVGTLLFAGDTTTTYAPPTLELYFAPPQGTVISIH